VDLKFTKFLWLLPVLRLTEVTMTENSLCLAGKIPVLVKLMSLTIYAKTSSKAKATNFGFKAKAKAKD